jgi:hypothetical protein
VGLGRVVSAPLCWSHFISDGGDIAKRLRAFLIGQADPTTPLVAVEAKAQLSQLVIDLGIDPGSAGETVIPSGDQALTNPIQAFSHWKIFRSVGRSFAAGFSTLCCR